MSDLTSLPEIGKVIAANLEAVGIPDAATLRQVGAHEAFERIRAELDAGACLQMLTALESGIHGVRASELTPQDRAELRDWFRSLTIPS